MTARRMGRYYIQTLRFVYATSGGVNVTSNEIFDGKRHKALQDFPRCHHPSSSEVEYDESAVRSLFHNFGISNYLFLKPGDRVEGSNLFAT